MSGAVSVEIYSARGATIYWVHWSIGASTAFGAGGQVLARWQMSIAFSGAVLSAIASIRRRSHGWLDGDRSSALSAGLCL
ncbi:MAG: hypothetical protein JWO59_3275 [Chloroflexi bacterium]|nr:hypothetical protein [Chloroflexota bacterium]